MARGLFRYRTGLGGGFIDIIKSGWIVVQQGKPIYRDWGAYIHLLALGGERDNVVWIAAIW